MTLFINACVRSQSRTLELSRHLLSLLPSEDVVELNLYNEDLPELNLETLSHRDGCNKAGNYADPIYRYARQFAEADTVVIAAPYWDLGFPARVKRYLELVTAAGVTFFYTPEGFPQGLCKAKHLYYVTTAGGPIFANTGFDYVRTMAESFYGIPESLCFKAEYLDVIDADVPAVMAKAKEYISTHFNN